MKGNRRRVKGRRSKRYLMYAAGHNLGVIMRKLFGVGTPRSLQTEVEAGLAFFSPPLRLLTAILGRSDRMPGHLSQITRYFVVSGDRLRIGTPGQRKARAA